MVAFCQIMAWNGLQGAQRNMISFRSFQAAIVMAGLAILLPACGSQSLAPAASASLATQTHGNTKRVTMSLSLGANTYSNTHARPLDSGDDSTWWANGGSYGQVSGGGSGCHTNVCPNLSVIPTSQATSRHSGGSSTIQPMNLGGTMYLDTICYYQEVTPGIEDPAHDTPLGCDFVDFYGNEISSGGQPGFDPSVHGGSPGERLAFSCSSAPETQGDTFIFDGKVIAVYDENSLWENNAEVGWLYKGSDGNIYIQANYASQPGISFGAGLGIFSISVSTPGGYSEIEKYPGKLPTGVRNARCITRGGSLA